MGSSSSGGHLSAATRAPIPGETFWVADCLPGVSLRAPCLLSLSLRRVCRRSSDARAARRQKQRRGCGAHRENFSPHCSRATRIPIDQRRPVRWASCCSPSALGRARSSSCAAQVALTRGQPRPPDLIDARPLQTNKALESFNCSHVSIKKSANCLLRHFNLELRFHWQPRAALRPPARSPHERRQRAAEASWRPPLAHSARSLATRHTSNRHHSGPSFAARGEAAIKVEIWSISAFASHQPSAPAPPLPLPLRASFRCSAGFSSPLLGRAAEMAAKVAVESEVVGEHEQATSALSRQGFFVSCSASSSARNNGGRWFAREP